MPKKVGNTATSEIDEFARAYFARDTNNAPKASGFHVAYDAISRWQSSAGTSTDAPLTQKKCSTT